MTDLPDFDVVPIPEGCAVVVRTGKTDLPPPRSLRQRLAHAAGHDNFLLVILAPGTDFEVVTDPARVAALKEQTQAWKIGDMAVGTWRGRRIHLRYGTSTLGPGWEVLEGSYFGVLPDDEVSDLTAVVAVPLGSANGGRRGD